MALFNCSLVFLAFGDLWRDKFLINPNGAKNSYLNPVPRA